jgi:putative holliday junction resolvase
VSVEGRILAIDFGLRRLGLAVSDPLGLTAQGLPTIQGADNADRASELIAKLVDEFDVREVLIGNPLSKDGAETAMSRRVAKFASRLRRRISREVKLWDERLTSAEAQRLLRTSGIGLEKRRRAVDRVAATLILQGYLDWRARENGPPEARRSTE